MTVMTREDILEFASQLDDPEELCADLVEAVKMFMHDGDPSELEELIDTLESFADLSKMDTPNSWSAIWSGGDLKGD